MSVDVQTPVAVDATQAIDYYIKSLQNPEKNNPEQYLDEAAKKLEEQNRNLLPTATQDNSFKNGCYVCGVMAYQQALRSEQLNTNEDLKHATILYQQAELFFKAALSEEAATMAKNRNALLTTPRGFGSIWGALYGFFKGTQWRLLSLFLASAVILFLVVPNLFLMNPFTLYTSILPNIANFILGGFGLSGPGAAILGLLSATFIFAAVLLVGLYILTNLSQMIFGPGVSLGATGWEKGSKSVDLELQTENANEAFIVQVAEVIANQKQHAASEQGFLQAKPFAEDSSKKRLEKQGNSDGVELQAVGKKDNQSKEEVQPEPIFTGLPGAAGPSVRVGADSELQGMLSTPPLSLPLSVDNPESVEQGRRMTM